MKIREKNKVFVNSSAVSCFKALQDFPYAPAIHFAPCVFKFFTGEALDPATPRLDAQPDIKKSAPAAFFHTIEHDNNNYSNIPAEIETAAFKAQAPTQSSNQGQGVQRQTKKAPGNAPGAP
jgi:hypothetical protein